MPLPTKKNAASLSKPCNFRVIYKKLLCDISDQINIFLRKTAILFVTKIFVDRGRVFHSKTEPAEEAKVANNL